MPSMLQKSEAGLHSPITAKDMKKKFGGISLKFVESRHMPKVTMVRIMMTVPQDYNSTLVINVSSLEDGKMAEMSYTQSLF